ncbi:choline dehydrogenase [Pseudonocardiaceae bacterium YIM PH 21723]|nr:choline dehydrogenase [Pseudonocardiaceae bacterium YIM PH 21723]
MKTFDYIVVGSGPAGCVLAARLSENPDTSVLLLEAGRATPPATVTHPPSWIDLADTDLLWPRGGDDHITPGRGRVLGGSSTVNAMVFLRGHHSSYDGWPPGWRFDDLLPYFQRIETANGRTRGTSGPLIVSPAAEPNPVLQAAIRAAAEVGHPLAADISGGWEEGFGFADLTIVDGRRQSAADAYLSPALGRPNLTVRTSAQVQRLLIARQRCIGVEYLGGEEPVRVFTTGEVIVAAGTIGSPHLLMLSGIGPADSLRTHGIRPVADLPEVGANLQDHPLAGVVYESSQPVPAGTNNHGEAVGLVRSRAELDHPDLQILLEDIPRGPVRSGYSITPSVMLPFSRGSVELTSADPLDPPKVDARLLSDPRDLDTMVAGLRIAREIGRARALDPWRGTEILPGPDADLRRYAYDSARTYFHPVGTCRIGGVVDTDLRVHGLAGLRIADASVLPTLPSANTNATVYAIAEKAADLIRG